MDELPFVAEWSVFMDAMGALWLSDIIAWHWRHSATCTGSSCLGFKDAKVQGTFLAKD